MTAAIALWMQQPVTRLDLILVTLTLLVLVSAISTFASQK